jgi:hypothetical protein
MENPLCAFKVQQKGIAGQIREFKEKRPQGYRNGWMMKDLENVICSLKRQYRHRHIAYCVFRGREVSDIEKKCRSCNKRNEGLWAAYHSALSQDVKAWRNMIKRQNRTDKRNNTEAVDPMATLVNETVSVAKG